jgi:hypothetical protein
MIQSFQGICGKRKREKKRSCTQLRVLARKEVEIREAKREKADEPN